MERICGSSGNLTGKRTVQTLLVYVSPYKRSNVCKCHLKTKVKDIPDDLIRMTFSYTVWKKQKEYLKIWQPNLHGVQEQQICNSEARNTTYMPKKSKIWQPSMKRINRKNVFVKPGMLTTSHKSQKGVGKRPYDFLTELYAGQSDQKSKIWQPGTHNYANKLTSSWHLSNPCCDTTQKEGWKCEIWKLKSKDTKQAV